MKRASLVLAALALAACKKEQPAKQPAAETGAFTLKDATAGLPEGGKLMADISTPQGTITCELYPEQAPETVTSFVGLARGLKPWTDPTTHETSKGKPFFDGLAFHRVIPGFMIQGGDPLSRDYANPMIGMGGPGYTLPDELDPNLLFDRPGRLAMANTGPRTHSGGSQFFITEAPKASLNHGYVIFGQCDNPEIVHAIAMVPRNGEDKPDAPVTMTVKIYRR